MSTILGDVIVENTITLAGSDIVNVINTQVAATEYMGDVTSPSGSNILTLATVNANVGTFNNVTINGKGLATAGSNVSYLTTNQSITLSGDFSGTGTTGITGTLATVNSNVGTFGSTTTVPVITTNGKGLTTAISSVSLTNASVGLGNVTNSLQVINAGNGVSFSSGTLASRPISATNGRLYATTNDGIYLDNGTSWVLQDPAYTGDVTKSAGATVLTLGTVNSNIGTFNNITINAKGLATAGSNVNYLLDPTTNGIVVRTALNTTTTRTNTGTNNQITVTNGDGTGGNPTYAIANNPVIPGTASMTLPSGLTSERDTATQAQIRFNTNTALVENSRGNFYIPTGRVLQYLTGNIVQTTGTTILPYDATLPTSTEGFQIWTQTITPIYPSSTIVVIFNVSAEVSSNSNTTTMVLFNGTTAISTSSALISGNNPFSLGITKSFATVSVTPITLSARIGPNAAATVYVNRGNTETFAGTTNTSYIIMEIV